MAALFRLIFFGGTSIEGPDGSIGGRTAQPRSMALLAILASSPAGTTRDKLAGYLWPDTENGQARHLLNNLLYHLRRVLGSDAVVSTGESLRLNRDRLSIDTVDFTEAVAAGDFERLHTIYTGPFLDGLYLSNAAEFERWVDMERNRLARLYAQALERAARQETAACNHTASAEYWSRVADAEPFNSRVAIELARALRDSGNVAGAVQTLHAHGERLRSELGIEPHTDAAAVLQELQAYSSAGAPGLHRQKSTSGNGRGRSGREKKESGSTNAAVRSWSQAKIIGVGAVVLLVAALGVIATGWMAGTRSPDVAGTGHRPPVVVVADFGASGGDTTASALLTEALRAVLEASPTVRAYSINATRQMLRRMELPATTRVSDSIAREIAVREGLPLILTGDIRQVDKAYLLTARLVAAADNSTIAAFREKASSSARLIGSIDRLSKSVRGKLGESFSELGSARRLDDVTTASLEALQNYSLARRALREGNGTTARLLFEKAVSLDSTFAMAWHYLSVQRASAFDDTGAADARERAFRFREKLPPYERYLLEGGYWWQEGEPERASAAWQAALELRPNDVGTLNNLAVYYGPRRQDKFVEMATRAFKGDPGAPASVVNYAVALFRQGQFDSAQRLTHAITPRPPGMPVLEANMLMTRGEYDTAERILLESWRDAEGKQGRHMEVAWNLAGLTAVTGRLKESIEWMNEVKKSPGLSRPDSLRVETVIARLRLFVGADTVGARVTLSRAVARHARASIPIASRPLLDVAHAYVATGQWKKASAVLREYTDSVPQSLRWRQLSYYEHVAGMVALANLDHGEAVRHLHASGRHGCGPCEHSGMAQLYESMHRPDSAIVQYERYLQDAGPWRWGWDSWWLAFSLERLGQLHEEAGDREKAATYYERLADLWKSADPDLQPRVRAARSAAARLRNADMSRRQGPRAR